MRCALAITLLVGCFTLAACGGDDDGDETTAAAPVTTPEAGGAAEGAGDRGEDDEPQGGGAASDQPLRSGQVIEVVLTGSESPNVICGELVTESYVRQAYGGREGCLAAQEPGALARSVEIEDLGESGDSASAIVVPSGGPYAGVEVEVDLVADPQRAGAWRVDSLFADVPAGP
jgi:hypothetical protein